MAFQLVQAAYWLALSLWFGSAVFLAIAAAAIFRGVREQNPVLPHVLAVNLNDQHATLLASTIVSHLLNSIGKAQTLCAAVVLLAGSLHFWVADTTSTNMQVAVLRLALATAAAVLLGVDRFLVAPRLARHRQTYIDHADEPEVANPAKDAFDKDQQRALWLVMASVGLLLGLVLFSAPITPAHDTHAVQLNVH
jgi:hypothetical protein